MSDIVKKLRDLERWVRNPESHSFKLSFDLFDEAADEIERLLAREARLREALRPLATLWLYPDDLGFEEASDIREDPDWDEDASDMQTDDQFILRKHIRAARDLVGGRDG